MKDRSLGIMLIMIFGLSGLAVMLLGWMLPSLEADRVTATITGIFGLVVASGVGIMLRPSTGKDRGTRALKVEWRSFENGGEEPEKSLRQVR
jgi:hypothetical protein